MDDDNGDDVWSYIDSDVYKNGNIESSERGDNDKFAIESIYNHVKE